jgi:hypothetical protein
MALGNEVGNTASIPLTIQGYLIAQRWITKREALQQIALRMVQHKYYEPRIHGSFELINSVGQSAGRDVLHQDTALLRTAS